MSKSFNPSTLGTVILVAATAAALWTINRGFPVIDVPEASRPAADASSLAPVPHHATNWSVPDVTVRDLDGKVVFHGTVDLSTTMERIERGERLRFHDDGSTFQNRERRLPHEPSGHYTEYVHPTRNLSGPGPQRVVTGKRGEVFYTPDHYRTFVRLR